MLTTELVNYSFTHPFLFKEVRKALRTCGNIEDVFGTKKYFREDIEVFRKALYSWMSSDPHVHVRGLESLPYFYDIFGITQAIQMVISETQKEVCFFEDDYEYYEYCCECMNKKYRILKDVSELKKDDFLLLSQPFGQSGNVRTDFEKIMEACNKLQVEVFIDAAFFGTVPNLSLQIYPCVTGLAISLSKTFGMESARMGFLFSRHKRPLLADLLDYEYVDVPSFTIVESLIRELSPAHLPRLYKSLQLEICKTNQLQASDCIWLGLKSDGQRVSLYDHYLNSKS